MLDYHFTRLKSNRIKFECLALSLFSFFCSVTLFLYLQIHGYLILDDSSDYIGLSRNFFRNEFHVDQNLEFWWPPLYYFVISPFFSSFFSQDTWIHFIQSITFGILVFELYLHLKKYQNNVTLLKIVALYVFIFSVPGLLKYFLTPHPEGLFLLFLLITLRLVENKQSTALVLFFCTIAYLTKYSAISLMAAISWYAIQQNRRNRYIIPIGCSVILGAWFLFTISKISSTHRPLHLLWQQKSFDFSGTIAFFFPFFPLPEWTTTTTFLFSGIFLSALFIWYQKTKSIYVLFAIFTCLLHLMTHFFADPTSFFDERLYLPSAIAISMALITNIRNKYFQYAILAFALIRMVPTIESLAKNTQLYSKEALLQAPYVQFLKKEENLQGSLCLIFQNKNHSSLFEKSKSFRLFRFPITAKPDVLSNLEEAKKLGYQSCYLVQRHFCPNTDILCDYRFSGPKVQVFSDPQKLPNGADIYKIKL